MNNLQMTKGGALYRVDLEDGVICIRDSCSDCRPSVTNDAENVIREVAAIFDVDSHPVIYRDSMGVWDELVVKDGRFDGFRSLNKYHRAQAIEEVKCRKIV